MNKITIKNIINSIFILIIIYLFLIAIFSLYRIYNPSQVGSISKTYLLFLFLSIFLIIINIYFIFISIKNKINILLIYFSLFFSILFIEIYLEIYKPNLPSEILKKERIQKAKLQNIPFDKRSKFEIIKEISNNHKKSSLKYEPYMLVEYDSSGLKYNNKKIFPLTGISNVYTTLSNENGVYPIILTDDYGFNNILKSKLTNGIDYALIGDSFTEGYSVEQNENIAAFLQKENLNVYNFGVGGSGPLVHYAIFREYIQKVKPKTIIWLFYEGNDIFPDIYRESQSNFLMRYLTDKNFEQNLIYNQDKINFVLRDFIKKKTSEYILLNNPYLRIMKLNNIRELLMSKKYTNHNSINTNKINDASNELIILENILLNVSNKISTWNGNFYFLYLPSYTNLKNNTESIYKTQIFEILQKLNIEYYNLETEIFDNYNDRLSFFPFGLNGHYNKLAYEKIANLILKL